MLFIAEMSLFYPKRKACTMCNPFVFCCLKERRIFKKMGIKLLNQGVLFSKPLRGFAQVRVERPENARLCATQSSTFNSKPLQNPSAYGTSPIRAIARQGRTLLHVSCKVIMSKCLSRKVVILRAATFQLSAGTLAASQRVLYFYFR